MHLIRSTVTKTMRQLPSVLPPTTLEAMKTGNRNSSRTASVSSNASGRYNQNFGTNSPVPRPAPAPVARQYTGPLQHPQLKSQQPEWSITPQDRAKFDSIFVTLDKNNTGVIGAEEVVPFLTTSTLPEETLAQVWDLADVHNTGQFSKTEFAIAMYLVQQKLAGKTLPVTLPTSLYPGEVQPAATTYFAQPQAQPQRQPPPKPPAVANSSLNDLLSLGDSLSTSPQPVAQVSENRTGSISVPAQLTGVRSAFVPTSSFGQSIAEKEPQFTSPPVSQVAPPTAAVFSQPSLTQPNFAVASPPPQQPQQSEFLDLETASKLSTLSTDNANLSNQVSSIGAQTEQAKQKRERAEAELSRVLGQKADLEARLATLRAEYDAEIKKSNQAEQLLHQSQQETDKLSADYSVLEASYHAVQTQCQEISSQLAYDQQENANLKEKIRFVSEETTNLKQTLEKLQKDARQQKGLVSINQKQYAHAEGERDRVQGQINDFSQQSREVHAPASSSVLAGIAGVAGATGVAAGAVIGAAGTAGAAMFSSPSHLHSTPTPTSTNPFYAAFTPQPLPENTPSYSNGFEDRFGQMEIASPSTADPARSSTHNTVDTPNSSPPTSDYQYNTVNARIPTFTLPLARPESATSSVQNNPPMSVRDDIDISRPDSPEFPVTSEPVSGIVPPDDLVIRSVEDNFERGTNLSTSQLPFPVDNLQHDAARQPSVATVTTPAHIPVTSSTESFEMVPRAGELPSQAVLSSSSESVETTHASSVPAAAHSMPAAPVTEQPVTSNNTGSTIEAVVSEAAPTEPVSAKGKEVVDANKEFDATFKALSATATGSNPWPATAKGEFPPIKELDYDESDSDEDDFNKAFSPSAGFPASSASFPSTATSAGTDMFVSAAASPAVLSSAPNVPSTSSPALTSAPKVSSTVTSPVAAQPVGAFGGSFASAPSFSLPMPSKEADPFDAAFDGLVVADEEKEDVPAAFPTSNAPFNFAPVTHAPPQFTGANMFSPAPVAAPAPAHPVAPAAAHGQNKSAFDLFPSDPAAPVDTGVPVSNEEWDSIFAGFGAPNAPASQMDINNAFAKAPAPQAAAAPPKPLSPQSQALSELVNMGFDKVKALEALKKNNFNVETAGNYLLDH